MATDPRSTFLLHSSEQPNPKAHLTEQWIRQILTYAWHRQLFVLRVEDSEVPGGDWDEILHYERINRLSSLTAVMIAKNVAVYELSTQTHAVLTGVFREMG